MTQQIVHHPRLAWDLAQVLVSTAEEDNGVSSWFANRFGEVLGPDFGQQLAATHTRLRTATRPDAHQVEVGLWRVRLEEVLNRESDLADGLQLLRQHTAARLAGRQSIG